MPRYLLKHKATKQYIVDRITASDFPNVGMYAYDTDHKKALWGFSSATAAIYEFYDEAMEYDDYEKHPKYFAAEEHQLVVRHDNLNIEPIPLVNIDPKIMLTYPIGNRKVIARDIASLRNDGNSIHLSNSRFAVSFRPVQEHLSAYGRRSWRFFHNQTDMHLFMLMNSELDVRVYNSQKLRVFIHCSWEADYLFREIEAKAKILCQ